MKYERDLFVRLGLVITGVLLIYTGFRYWEVKQVHIYREVVALCLISYLVGFSLIFLSAINYRKVIRHPYVKYLIFFFLIFVLLFSTYVYMLVVSPRYGTDAIALNHYSALLVLEGKNPYVENMAPAVEEFDAPKHLATFNTDGTTVNRTPYPALSFLVYIPFISAGLSDMRFVTLIFQILTICVIFLNAPKILKPLILLPLFLPDMLEFTGGGVTDFLWVLPLVLMVIYIDDIFKSGVLYGVACAMKPTPWFLAPFLLIWYWKTSVTLDSKKRLVKLMKFSSIAAIVFLIPNLPFILSNPTAWSDGALAPIFGKMVPFGSGLSVLSQVGMINLSKAFFSACVILVMLTLVINYWVYFNRLKYAIWIFPAIILWFSYRSPQNYFIYFVPLVLISICLWHAEMAKGEIKEKKPQMRTKKIWGLRYRRLVAPVSLAMCASLILVSGFVFRPREKLSIEVSGEIGDTENIGAVSELTVTVVNEGPTTVEPRFSIVGSVGGTFPFYWDIVSGPEYLEPNSSATYVIRAGMTEKAVPNTRSFIVRVNDASSDVYFVSEPFWVNLNR